jgi:hypothetical protein
MSDFVYSQFEPYGDRPVPDQTLRGWPNPDLCAHCGAETIDGICIRCDRSEEL